MLTTQFLQATLQDVENIMSLYRYVIKTTFTTWDDNYPDKELIVRDINNKNLFVLKHNDNIIAVSFVGYKEEENENWTYPLLSPIGVARICVSPDHQGQGIGTHFMKQLINIAKERGADGMHFHVCTQNPAAMKMYEKVGFVNCGLGKSNYGFDYYKYEQVF